MTTTASAAPGTRSARSTWPAPRAAGLVLGAVYLAAGVLGAALTGWSHLTSMHGRRLLVFQVNPLHNLAHLGLGAALVVGALVGPETARGTARLVGIVFLVLGLVGPFLMGSSMGSMNVLSVNDWDHALHFGTAALLLGSVWLTRAPRPAA